MLPNRFLIGAEVNASFPSVGDVKVEGAADGDSGKVGNQAGAGRSFIGVG
jgi:hypothetical protein